jgi:hypothetical protein
MIQRQQLSQPAPTIGNIERATRASRHSLRLASIAIFFLVCAFLAGLYIARLMDDSRFKRDTGIITVAIDTHVTDRKVTPANLELLNRHIQLPELRVGATDSKRYLEAAYPLPEQPGQALLWRRAIPIVELLTIILPLALGCAIAIFGCIRLARAHDRARHGDARRTDGSLQPCGIPAAP